MYWSDEFRQLERLAVLELGVCVGFCKRDARDASQNGHRSFEYDVLRDIVGNHIDIAPSQISLELHYQTQMMDLAWNRRYKTPAEMALFMLLLFNEGNYFLIDRHDNQLCGHCSELVLARLPNRNMFS
jgi:hypothetical protein